MGYKKILLLSLLFLTYSYKSVAQRYYFEQYDIDKGLTQSQVIAITQDQKRKLWIATLGGIGSFNGRQFTNYSRTNGLASNYNVALTVDNNNNLWIGSSGALTSYNGHEFTQRNPTSYWTRRLASTKSGDVYGLRKKNLFRIEGKREQPINITKDTMEYVTTITVDQHGRLWATVYNKGIYYLENGVWKNLKIKNCTLFDLDVSYLLIDNYTPNKQWLITPKGVFTVQNGFLKTELPEVEGKATAIAQDHKGGIWIGAAKGVYRIYAGKTTHFTSENGFTDNSVSTIFKDVENNIWLGTYGAGLFKFHHNNYAAFDESQGVKNRLVMGISHGPTPGTIWLGSYGGLYEYQPGKKIRSIKIPLAKNEEAYHINLLMKDSKKRIWIGTSDGGLWIASGNRFERVDKDMMSYSYQAILETGNKEVWVATNMGIFAFNEKTKSLDKLLKAGGNSLLEVGRDSIMIGTQDGAFLFTQKKNAIPIKNKLLMGSSILCMLKQDQYVLFGTSDYGLLIWDKRNGKSWTLNTKNGLVSDHVYSVTKDSNGIIWVGTGTGISRLDSKTLKIISTPDASDLLVECNQNALLQDGENMWIGTTKGAIVYNIHPMASENVRPYVAINSINVYPSDKSNKRYDFKTQFKNHELKERPTFPYSHNYLSISFSGIYLTRPNALLYKYRLVGLDNKFSQAGGGTSVNFTALPAGKYKFEVIAITKNGLASINTASFSFEILPPYYQTNTFRFFVVLVVILLILTTVYIILTVNERRRKLRLKIKLEEQYKIRKQTAEDFHDDLGNKLTRITVLSEVLNSMLKEEDTEKRNIVKKIGTNVNELYTGTKDILWSLNPKNDTLDQLIDHIKEFGNEMFNDTTSQFKHDIDIPDNDIVLSLDMNRNILLIFKESIHNALKHARATEVYLKAKLNGKLLFLSLEDNGIGFDVNHAKTGHGMNNMYVRAERIGADLNVISRANGTAICVLVNFSSLNKKQDV